MRTVKFTLLAILICAGFILPGYSQTPGVKLLSTGEFTDKSGQVHTWKIDGNHTLVWDGQPYLPVGGVFYSKYICIDQTEENWQADVTALTTLKTAGITDLLLKAIGPVTWTKPEAWQRLVDYLDENGFTYGIDFSDGPKAPLNGFVIDPARYRLPDIIRDSTFEFDMPDVTSAVWMLCSATDGTVVSSGGASVVNGKVKVQISARPDQSCVLLLFPNREFSNGGRDGISDLWAGYDEFRDRLLLFIGKVKFGRGLRFFVDPIASKMDFPDDLLSVIPNSPEFRLEFEAYLAKKYLNIGSLNAAWGLVGDNLTSFQEAARLIPLWHAGRGLPAVYDRAKGKRYTIDAPRSKIWLDIYDFRDASTRNYLNTTADLLKRHSANVPVIYKASRHRQVLSNGNSRGGFDGLGVEAYGKGEELVTKAAGPVYSLAEESARSMWFIVTGTQDTLNRKKSTVGFASRESLLVDFDLLSEIGVKGIFVYGLQVLPEEHWKNHSLVLAPEQLAWLKEFKGKFSTSDRAEFKPDVLFYPTSPVAGADTRRLGPGRWWLPSIRTGSPVNMGETIGGYVLGGQDGFCLWSRIGAQTITIPIESSQKPTLVYPLGAEDILTVQKKKAVI
ncbi:MAG TPA: hypothetical protein PLU88_12070, partial [Armatimonadota bacterium]|nr:hypothetical protein [Armatimonadota bacterium]